MLRRFKWATLARVALTCCATSPALAKEAPKVAMHRLDVRFEATTDTRECREFHEAVLTYLRSLRRFELGKGKPDYTLELACSEESLSAIWLRAGKKPLELAAVTRKGMASKGEPAALAVINDLLKSLPWDGEVAELSTPTGSTLSKSTKTRRLYDGRLTLGRVGNDLLGVCLPIEVGIYDGKFQVIGDGVVRAVDEFSSTAELRIVKKKLGKAPRLVFRFASPGAMPKSLATMYEKCREVAGFASDTIFAVMFGEERFGTESIELNAIMQRGGAYVASLTAENGQKVPWTVLGYAHNEITLGTFFHIDARAVRHLTSPAFKPGMEEEKTPSQVTLAEAHLAGRFALLGQEFIAGFGMLIEKVPVPYYRDNGLFNRRVVTDRGAGLIKYAYQWDERQWSSARIGLSFSKHGTYTSLNVDHNIMLTSTWFVGADTYLLSLHQTGSVPGYRLLGGGIHLGFKLARARDAKD